MKDKNLNISNVYNQCIKKIHEYTELKDSVGINDISEFVGDVSKVYNLLRVSSNFICEIRFKAFLKGLGETGEPTEVQICKLTNYINDSKKAEYISNMFSKILLSKSNLSCIILGYLTKEVVENKNDVDHISLILVDALTNFFDYDIYNFKFTYEYINNLKSRRKNGFSCGKKFFDEASQKGIEKNSLMFTIEKAVYCQLMFKDIDIEGDVQNEDPDFNSVDYDEYYRMSPVGEKLYSCIGVLNI